MSIRLMSRVFESEHPPMEKLVLLALADHARDDGTGAYPSIDTLGKKTSLSRRGVQKILRRLEDDGLIIPTGNFRGGRNLTTEYRITLEKGEPGSLFPSAKGRTPGQERANLSAQKGEPGSPESLRTIREPKPKPPVVPLSGGQTKNLVYQPWADEWFEVDMGNRKRLMSERERQAMSGCRPKAFLAFLQQKRFQCRIVPKEEVASWQEARAG